jgi:hypothetical protein
VSIEGDECQDALDDLGRQVGQARHEDDTGQCQQRQLALRRFKAVRGDSRRQVRIGHGAEPSRKPADARNHSVLPCIAAAAVRCFQRVCHRGTNCPLYPSTPKFVGVRGQCGARAMRCSRWPCACRLWLSAPPAWYRQYADARRHRQICSRVHTGPRRAFYSLRHD